MNSRIYLYTLALIFSFCSFDSAIAMKDDNEEPLGNGKRANSTPKEGKELANVTKKTKSDKGSKTIVVIAGKAPRKAILPPDTSIPPTLGGCLKFYARYLSINDLVNLGKLSIDVRAGLYRKNPSPLNGIPMKFNVSSPFLDDLPPCRLPFEENPVEVIIDISNPHLIPKNMANIFEWMVRYKTSNLTLNFNAAYSNITDAINDISPNLSNTLLLFASMLQLHQERMPVISSLGLSHSDIETYPRHFRDTIHNLFPHVRHLTLDAITDQEDLFSPNALSRLTRLESLTLLNYSSNPGFNGPIFSNFEGFLKPTLKALTMRKFWSEYYYDLPKLWPPHLQSLELDEILIYRDDDDDVEDFFTPLAQNKALNNLVIKGCPFYWDYIEFSEGQERDKQEQALDFIKSKFSHLEMLRVEWR